MRASKRWGGGGGPARCKHDSDIYEGYCPKCRLEKINVLVHNNRSEMENLVREKLKLEKLIKAMASV